MPPTADIDETRATCPLPYMLRIVFCQGYRRRPPVACIVWSQPVQSGAQCQYDSLPTDI